MTEKKGLLTGNALKWIAIVTMLIDHVGATLVLQLFYADPTNDMLMVYYLVRSIGRIAFPIFCFLLVEGFCHTRSRGKYLLRLGLFALIAEIPFDLAFNWPEYNDFNVFGVLEFTSQNVFFTLFFGLCGLWLWDVLAKHLPKWAEYPAVLVATLPAWVAANLFCTDYDVSGIALIMALGIGRGLPVRIEPSEDGPAALLREPSFARRLFQCLMGCLAIVGHCYFRDNWIEIFAIIGLLFTLLYNGRRGRGGKWFFYIFYPVHLLILGILVRVLF
ncbi:MAG: conjugal transfer protein TraX [Oscillospiraceae bacterium]|nr:conjugal transfer protein TraX [Oscillospiraceae bacterium]